MAVAQISQPQKAPLPIDFVVIGGSLSGLAAAYALTRVGHRVLVLEMRHDFLDESRGGGCRMPPNLSKVFYHWGLEEKVRKLAMKSSAVAFKRLESGESLGEHVWEEEVLKETGGDFIFAHHSDLRKFLYDQALESGAKFRANAKVVDIDVQGRSVTLESGEIITADVIVGADGLYSLTRQWLVGDKHENYIKTGMVMYNALITGDDILADPELAHFLNSSVQHVWFGDGAASLVYRLGGNRDLGFHLYVQSEAEQSWDVSVEELVRDAQGAEVQQVIRQLAKVSKNIIRIPVCEVTDLEDWVHDDGPLVTIGDAAHLMPPASVQSACMGIEDAAVLAKLFSHLSSADQIQGFLYAFQDLRQARCKGARVSEMGNLYFMALPNGEQQAGRDALFRDKSSRGLSPLSDDSTGASDEWEMIKDLFGYDAEDEADAWWHQWGLLRERSKHIRIDSCIEINVGMKGC